jgi:hypothetical protein
MGGMERPRGRRVALVAAACAAAVVVAAAIVGRDMILERWWIWRLGSEDPATWRAAAEKLGEMRSVLAVPRLVEVYLRGKGDHVELKPFPPEIFLRIGTPAVPPVARRISSEDIRLRFLAAGILGEIGHAAREALPVLEKMAADLEEEEDVHEEARWAIGRIGR